MVLLICKDLEVLPQTSSRVTPAEKDGRKSEGQKASGNRRVYELVTFFLIMHTCDNLNEVEQFVREIDGVESVRGDSNSNKLEVKGKVDPGKIRKTVQRKTKKKVKLIFPPAESEGYGDEHERGDKKLEEKTRPDDVANTKSEESVTVLKIKFCCNSCNQKLKKILEVKGLETVAMDMDKDLVTVKGTVNMKELISCIKGVIKRDVEVVVPAKKDTVATKKKDRETDAIDKKDKDAGPIDKKGKEGGCKGTIMREEENVPTDKETKGKGKNAGSLDKKGKEVGTAEVRDKDSEHKGNAGVPNKSGKKDSGVNQKKDKNSGHRKNDEASSDGSRLRNNHEDGNGVTMKVNMPQDERSVDYTHDYSPRDRFLNRRPVTYSNGYDMFSDENPHSCTIL